MSRTETSAGFRPYRVEPIPFMSGASVKFMQYTTRIRLIERTHGTLVKKERVMNGSRARPMCHQNAAAASARPPTSHQRGLAAARVSRSAQEEKIASPVTSTRPARERAGTRLPMTGTQARPARGMRRRIAQLTSASRPPTSMPRAVPPWKAAHMSPT